MGATKNSHEKSSESRALNKTWDQMQGLAKNGELFVGMQDAAECDGTPLLEM